MKLASYILAQRPSFGVVDGDVVHDLGGIFGHEVPDLKSLLERETLNGINTRLDDAAVVPLSEITFLPVIPNPGKILCVGHNYETHRQETGRDATAYPSIFVRFADSQAAHGQYLLMPAVSTMLDYEGELAVVIGKSGRNIAQEDAFDHVIGYACYNDASVRDWQWHTRQFTPGKNFQQTGAFGPCLVTVDEIPDPSALSVTTRVNGEIVQSQPTADMIFSVPVIVNYVSQFTQLSVGDVIVTGTPGGVGAKRNPPRWLVEGDVVEVEIPGVGCLQNIVSVERP